MDKKFELDLHYCSKNYSKIRVSGIFPLTRASVLAERGHGLSASVVVYPLVPVVLEAVGACAVCQHGWMRKWIKLEVGAVFPPDGK